MSAFSGQRVHINRRMMQLGFAACMSLYAFSAFAQVVPHTVVQTSQVKNARIASAPDDMFIDMHVPAHQIYLGETLRVQYDVYVASRRGQVFYEVEEPDFVKWYALEGAASPASHVSVGGQAYTLEPFAVYFAAPVTVGRLPLPTLKVQVPFESSKPWITHLPRFIEVIPPPSPAPEHFAVGNVGTFQLQASLSKTEARVGDVITIQIEIQGTAPVSGIKLAPFALSSAAKGFKVYPFHADTLEEKIVRDQFQSVITGHIQLLALEPGKWEIDPIRLSAFNPQTHQYQTYETAPMNVEIEDSGKSVNLSQPRAKTLQLEAWAVVPIQLQKSAHEKPMAWVWYAVPPILLVLVLTWLSSRRRKASQERVAQEKEHIEQLFMQLERAQNAQEQWEILNEIFKLCYHWELSPSQSVAEQWLKDHFGPEDAESLILAIQKLQMFKYSTQEVLPSAMVEKVCAAFKKRPK